MGIRKAQGGIDSHTVDQVVEPYGVRNAQTCRDSLLTVKGQGNTVPHFNGQGIGNLRARVIIRISRIGVIQVTSHPTRIVVIVVTSPHHPYVSATEVRTVHVFVGNVLNYRKIPFIVHGFGRGHVRMQAHLTVVGQVGIQGNEFTQAIFWNGDVCPVVIIRRILIDGNNGVKSVVSAVHFNQY